MADPTIALIERVSNPAMDLHYDYPRQAIRVPRQMLTDGEVQEDIGAGLTSERNTTAHIEADAGGAGGRRSSVRHRCGYRACGMAPCFPLY